MQPLRRTARLIDPSETVRRDVERRLGVRNQRDILREVSRVQRGGAVSTGPHPSDSLLFHRADVGAIGDASYVMRTGNPSSDTAWAMSGIAILLPRPGRIVGGWVWTFDPCTAGRGQLRAQIKDANGTHNIDIPGAVLDLAHPSTASGRIPWEKAAKYSFGENATIEARFVTTGTWAPTTSDITGKIIFEYD